MATQFQELNAAYTKFIREQHMFFVATAGVDGRVNVSPKGMDCLRIISPNRLIWRNLTGSGNETAGHLKEVNRMTLMWCSLGEHPLVLRIYGTARTLHERDEEFGILNASFPEATGARQIFDVNIEMVQKSCGYAVPFYDYIGERHVLSDWAKQKGDEGVKTYWSDRNQETIDGKPTGILS